VRGHPAGKIDRKRLAEPARHEPTVAETQLLLQTIQNEGGYPTNLIARLACGLRSLSICVSKT
jgi:hypothetical protein